MPITTLDLSNNSTLTLTNWANTTNKVITALNVVMANTDIASNTWVRDYGNATNVLTRIKTVDGAGSGLDADLLDGQTGAYYSNASNISTGTLADARLPSTQAGKTFTTGVSGTSLTLSSTLAASGLVTAPKVSVTNTVSSANVNATLFSTANAFVGKTTTPVLSPSTSGTIYLRPGGYASTTNQLALSTSALTIGGQTIWHAGNDGAGSGLDADLLDGQSGAYYSNASNISTGTLADARLPSTQAGKTFTTGVSGTSLTLSSTLAASGHVTAPKFTATNTVASANVNATLFSTANAFVGKTTTPVFGSPSTSGTVYLRPNGPTSTTNQVALSTSAFTVGGQTIWHAGNDGAGSGLDADLLDGQTGAYYSNASNISTGTLADARLPSTQAGKTFTTGVSGTTISASGHVTAPKFTATNTVASANVNATLFSSANVFIGKTTTPVLSPSTSGTIYLRPGGYASTTNQIAVNSSSFTVGGQTIWHAGNDGSLSTLDADLLDGQHGSYYQNADNLNAGTLPAARFNDTSHGTRAGGTLHSAATTSVAGFMSASDKSKLDGIETAADVTDATNVGSSIDGATAKITPVDADTMPLIDSAATNTLKKVTWANVKATAKTYYDTVYAAIGRSIIAGNGMTGGGTLAVDRTLTLGTPSTITSSTTNDVTSTSHTHALTLTGSDVLTRILTVDGTASGLDADLLDGQHGSYYSNASNISTGTLADARLPSTQAGKTFTTGVSGTSLTLSSTLAASGHTTAPKFTATNTVASANVNATLFSSANVFIGKTTTPILAPSTSGTIYLRPGGYASSTNQVALTTSAFTVGGNAVWHAGNDGTGSTLDADLLDGQHGSYYLPASTYTASDVLTKIKTVDGAGSGLDADLLDGQTGTYYASNSYVISLVSSSGYVSNNYVASVFAQNTYVNTISNASNMLIRIKTVDGTGSGLDADLLDGQEGSYYLPASTYTASDVLTKIKTVDGTGTGLDADLLDGQHGSYYLPASTYTASDVLSKILTVDGTGTGLDADLLDGQHGSYYLPASTYTASDVLTKIKTVDGTGSGLDADLLDGQEGSYYQNAGNLNAGTLLDARMPTRIGINAKTIVDWNDAIESGWYKGYTATNAPSAGLVGTLGWIYGEVISYSSTYCLQKVWPATVAPTSTEMYTAMRIYHNGSWGSWFKALVSQDEMDARYAELSGDTFTGAVSYNSGISFGSQTGSAVNDMANHIKLWGTSFGFSVTSNQLNYIGTSHNFYQNTTRFARISTSGVESDTAVTAKAQFLSSNTTWIGSPSASGTLYLRPGGSGSTTNQVALTTSAFTVGGNAVWHAGNDGTGSGLDADLLDGQEGSYYLPASTYTASDVLSKILTVDGTSSGLDADLVRGVTPSSIGTSILSSANSSVVQSTLGLTIGTDVQAYDAGLASISGLTTAADKMIYTTASDTYAVTNLSAFGRSLIDDADAATARTTLGLTIGTDVQAYDAELNAIAGLVSAADRGIYFTGSGTASLFTLTSTGRSLLDDTSTSAMRTTLGLTIGTDVQAYDAGLASIAGLTTVADRMIYTTASDTYAVATLTSFARTLLDDADASTARSTLGLTIGTDVQAYDAGLASIAGLTTVADRMIYTTASDTYAVATLTSFARTLLDDADASTARTTLGLAIGTDVQAYDAGLNSIAGLTTAADKMIYTTASDTYAVATLTSFARTLLDDADASTARTTLGITAASFSEFNSATSDRYIKNDSVWGDLAVLTDGATITVDMNDGYDFGGASNAALALGGNRTLGAPSNVRNGKKGILWFAASGSTRTLTLNAAWSLATGVETGPYSITTSQTLGIAYVCRGTTVYVTSIIRIG